MNCTQRIRQICEFCQVASQFVNGYLRISTFSESRILQKSFVILATCLDVFFNFGHLLRGEK